MRSGLRQTQAVAAPGAAAPARARRGAEPPAGDRGPGTAVTGAIVLATAVTRDGSGPAALLPWEGATVLARALEQLASLGIPAVQVLTRPAWAARVRDEVAEAAERAGLRAEVHAAPAVDGDLRRIESLAREGAGALVVMHGDVLTQREALAGLLADPRISTGILAGGGPLARPFAFRVRSRRGRVVSASSPYHATYRPTASFLGVLKVAPADRAALAAAAGRLASITAQVPSAWRDELYRKEGMWRYALYRAALGDEAMGTDDELEPLDRYALELSDEDEERLRERLAAAPDDAVSLLLVGLVRAGLHIGASHLRKLYWARPLSPGAIALAERQITDYDEDKVLLDSAVKASDGFFTTFFVSPYSRYIARWAAHRGFTPNQITTVSVLIGVLAAAAFATGERWGLIAGAVLLQVAFATDCVDGQLARYTRTFSRLGAWLDSVFDRTKEYVAFAGLAIGASRMGEPAWLLAVCALALQSVRHTADFAYGAGQQQAIGATPQPPVEQARDAWSAVVEARRAARQQAIDAAVAAGTPIEEAVPSPLEHTPVERLRRVLHGVLGVWHVFDGLAPVRWAKKMVTFPIGERFAVVSITAALFTPRVTFVVLLAWGGFAACYTLAGRVLRSLMR